MIPKSLNFREVIELLKTFYQVHTSVLLLRFTPNEMISLKQLLINLRTAFGIFCEKLREYGHSVKQARDMHAIH